uniref:Uncharacterized protein n=1 Tax=Trepomonas sp. PC1 TaxID=1076344 RepID=A0A146KIA7_9EUKA|eukprot:JAP95121.1 Hypothetical protein TPC1_11989 [Trepomonas sp. PC1]
MNYVGPVSIFWDAEELKIEQIIQKLTAKYGNQMLLKCITVEGISYGSLYTALSIIDYKQLKFILDIASRQISNKKLIMKHPDSITEEIFQKLVFTKEEADIIQQQNSQMLSTLRQLVSPSILISFKQNESVQTYLTNLKNDFQCQFQHKILINDKFNFLSLLFNKDLMCNEALMRRQFYPEAHVKRTIFQDTEASVPDYMDFNEYVKLAFTKEDLLLMQNTKDTEITDKVSPQVFVRFEDKEQGASIIANLKSMYPETALKIKTVSDESNIYMSAIYNSQIVNYNTLWYCIPKDIKRFVVRGQLHHAPPFVPELVYNDLFFDKEDLIQLQQKEIQFVNDQLDIAPRILIVLPNEKTLDFANQLQEKLRGGHVYVKSYQMEFGAGAIGVLFKEPMFKYETLRHYTSDFYTTQTHFDVVPPTVLKQLHFPSALWTSLGEFSEVITQKNAVNSQQMLQKPQKEHLKLITTQKKLEIKETLIILDFEAFIFHGELTFPSELAAVRIENNQVVAQFHCMINQDLSAIKDTHEMKLAQVYKLTGIPFVNQVKGLQLEEVSVRFQRFCRQSSAQLQDLENVKLFCLFQEQKDFTLVAKGSKLEKIGLEQMQFKHQIEEFYQIFNQIQPTNAEYKQLMKLSHSRSRHYDYCDFHQKIEKKFNGEEMIHCALDDVSFLAKVLLGQVKADQADESVEKTESSEEKEIQYVEMEFQKRDGVKEYLQELFGEEMEVRQGEGEKLIVKCREEQKLAVKNSLTDYVAK